MLVDVPVGENPAGGTCPVATVVISGGGAGDQSAGSPEVKVSVGWGETSGQLRQGRRASRQVVTNENRSKAPKFGFPTIESERGMWKVPSPSGLVRRPASSVKELVTETNLVSLLLWNKDFIQRAGRALSGKALKPESATQDRVLVCIRDCQHVCRDGRKRSGVPVVRHRL
jgi:hypothetical protein